MKKLPLLILVACCVSELSFAQENQRTIPSGDGQRASQASAPAAATVPAATVPAATVPAANSGAVSTQQSQQSRGRRFSGRKSSGRQLSQLKPLKTRSGSMPGFMQRAAARNSQQASLPTAEAAASGNQATQRRTAANGMSNSGRSNSGAANGSSGIQNQTSSGLGTQQNLQQVFVNNALLFDENSDNQLAANELRNLFVLLISENVQNTQNNYYGFGNGNRIVGGVQYGQTGQSLGNRNSGRQNSVNQNSGQIQSSGFQAPVIGVLLSDAVPNLQGSSMQEVILLFLLLTLQFDIDGDGALNQFEIQQFATALLNNELNLAQAVSQPQRRR